MKKNTLLILCGFIFILSMNLYVKADYQPVKETNTTIKGIDLIDSPKPYYKLKKAIKQKIRVSDNHGEANRVTYIKLPKGTILDDGSGIEDDIRMRDASDLSYHLIKKAYAKNTYGPTSVASLIYNKKTMKRVKKPDYLLNNKSNYYLSGGLDAFKNNKYQSNLIKITTDGYLETYQYNPITFKEGSTKKTLNYRQKPNGYAKIKKVKTKKNHHYFYFSHKIKGINLTKVKSNHKVYYRLKLTNLMTPYSKFIIDPPARIYVNMYKIANKPYYGQVNITG